MNNPITESIPAPEATTETVNQSMGLPAEERQTLGVLEETIAKGQGAFAETGLALAKIRDENLHLEAGFKSFETYCRGRWGLSRARAYQLIDAAVLAVHLSTFVDIASPTNESQLRPMAGRNLDDALEIWKLANEKASGAPVTGRLVKDVIKSLFGEPPKPVKPIADQLEGVLRSCRHLADHLADTDLANLDPKQKSLLVSIADAVGELARKAQLCNAPAETAKRSKEELIKEAHIYSRRRPPNTDPSNLDPKQKFVFASITEAVGELSRKAQPCNAPAETATRSKEELIKEARAFSRQRPRPPLNYPANLQSQK